jgi:hypothetical protein
MKRITAHAAAVIRFLRFPFRWNPFFKIIDASRHAPYAYFIAANAFPMYTNMSGVGTSPSCC